jgi:hypothetical protein
MILIPWIFSKQDSRIQLELATYSTKYKKHTYSVGTPTQAQLQAHKPRRPYSLEFPGGMTLNIRSTSMDSAGNDFDMPLQLLDNIVFWVT